MSFRKSIETFCKSVCRHPFLWLFITLLPSIPALYEIQNIGLNTDIVRLLPDHSPAAKWTRQLEKTVGDGGFFTILLKGEDRQNLIKAVEKTSKEVGALPEVDSVVSTNPVGFIQKYKYLLISKNYLEKILDHVLEVKAKINPLTDDLLSPKEKQSSRGEEREQDEMMRLLDHYSNLPPYHESEDGKIFGIFIRPKPGITKIKDLHALMVKLEGIRKKSGKEFGVWTGIGGSQIDNLRNYDVILSDLNRSGLITVAGVLLVLIISFRSFSALPILLYPLGTGLLWSFALVPPILHDLNIITSFLLLVMFGLGIDCSIHLVKRFQQELAGKSPEDALIETYRSTGMSIITSSLTTGLALLVLAFSDFRGFSEFGLIGGGTMLVMLVAMFTVMPPTLILGEKWHLIRPDGVHKASWLKAYPGLALLIALVLPLCLAAMGWNLRFDYNFNNIQPKIPGNHAFNTYNKAVYKTKYMSPGAIYVAPDLKSLDILLAKLKQQMQARGTYFLKTTSARNFAPTAEQTGERLKLIKAIQEQLQGNWTRKIKDPLLRQWARDFVSWTPPARPPTITDLPAGITNSLLAGKQKNLYLVGLYPNVERGDGENAMGFTKEMYSMKIPEGIQGPVGEMPVFAEILWTVTAEGPWVLIMSFLSVFVLIFLGFRSLKETVWITLPLISGLILTMGIMAVTSFRLNFFNVVIFPALIGMGVDSGVHFFRRWKELNMETSTCLQELFEPLTGCTVTTMMGYSGMVFASHPGLRSIGLLACLGLTCIWLTSLVLFPGLLEYLKKRKKKSPQPGFAKSSHQGYGIARKDP